MSLEAPGLTLFPFVRLHSAERSARPETAYLSYWGPQSQLDCLGSDQDPRATQPLPPQRRTPVAAIVAMRKGDATDPRVHPSSNSALRRDVAMPCLQEHLRSVRPHALRPTSPATSSA